MAAKGGVQTKSVGTVDVEAIRERCEAATEGPWILDQRVRVWLIRSESEKTETEKSTTCCVGVTGITGQFTPTHLGADSEFVHSGTPEENANFEFIAHTREDIPALLARVEELEGALEKVLSCWTLEGEAHKVFTHGDANGTELIAPTMCDCFEGTAKIACAALGKKWIDG